MQVCYRLTPDNRMEISYLAQVDRPCPVNLTNHAYFNLDGAGTDARAQRLQLFADRYLPVDPEGIPCAELTPVDGSGMDFRQPKTLLQDFLRDRDQQRVKATITLFCCIAPAARSARRPIYGPPTGKCR